MVLHRPVEPAAVTVQVRQVSGNVNQACGERIQKLNLIVSCVPVNLS